jgi:hypothetical protein
MKTMIKAQLNGLNITDPRPKAPYRGLPFEQVEIIQTRDQAIAGVKDLGHDPGEIIFTDASTKDDPGYGNTDPSARPH